MTTILIVDDEPPIAHLFRDVFEEEGYHVVLASDGRDALDKVAAVRPDIILSDVMMPRMSGLELCAALSTHAVYQSIPLILVSAATIPGSTATCRCSARLLKPVDILTLINTVERVLVPPSPS